MSTWKPRQRDKKNWTANTIEWYIDHDMPTNFMSVGWDDRFQVALLGAESNIGPTSRLFSDVTAKLSAPSGGTAGIPVNADPSVWAAYAASAATARWEVLYGVGGLGGETQG